MSFLVGRLSELPLHFCWCLCATSESCCPGPAAAIDIQLFVNWWLVGGP